MPLEKTGGGGFLGDEYTIDKGMSKERKEQLKSSRCPLCTAQNTRAKDKMAEKT